MRHKLLALLVLAVLGSAWVLSGRSAPAPGKGAAAARPAQRQIQVLAQTPEYRLVRHRLGDTEVPCAPQRIASLAAAVTDNLLALELRPVAVEGSWNRDGVASYLAERLRDVPTVSRGGTVNLEALLAARPDLILAGNVQEGRLYEQLNRIAPTVFLGSEGIGEREEGILDLGEVLGLSARARQRLAAYRGRIAEARQTLAGKIGSQPVVFLRFRMQTCVIYSRTPMVGPLLFDRLGLTPDPLVPPDAPRGGWDVLSVERLSLLRAEHIFLAADPDSERFLREIVQTPIWQGLPAVQHGHVHRVRLDTWLGTGILAYEAMLGDLLAAVAPERSS